MLGCINLDNQRVFEHHRSGWSYAIRSLRPLHNSSGVKFLGFLDLDILGGGISESFVGVVHNPLFVPADFGRKYVNNPGLYRTFLSKNWKASASYCLGLYVLSRDLAGKVSDFVSCPVEVLHHPIEGCGQFFKYDRYVRRGGVLHLGQWMRRFDSFYRLRLSRPKYLLSIPDDDMPDGWEEVMVLGWVPHGELDRLLSFNVVFNHFFDVSACNAVLDCIIRNTPIVLNRLPANEEYLGRDYPLFFDRLCEAEDILNDDSRIKAGHEYLVGMDKSNLQGDFFMRTLSSGGIYRSLMKRGERAFKLV